MVFSACSAAEERPDIQLEGIDISPPAVAVANRILAASGHAGRVKFEVKDILAVEQDSKGGKYQGIIAAMLAEHLEDPGPCSGQFPAFLPKTAWFFSAQQSNPPRGTTSMNSITKASR